ncbi:hypothetical protein Tco_0792287 [Tanacetum coccineum]
MLLTKPYALCCCTPTGANTGGSSFVYLGGQIPIDASTLPNADLPIDPSIPDLEDDSNVFPNNGTFSGAYDDEDVGIDYGEVFAQLPRIGQSGSFSPFASFMAFPCYKMDVKSAFFMALLEWRSMISSLMYLTVSRPDIMFAVCARKSTTGGCQFLGRRLISWQCKKQTIVENSTTETEYVIAANYCGTSMNLRMDGSCAGSLSHIWSVLLLGLPFISTISSIYDSLVKNSSWQTANVLETLAIGIQEFRTGISGCFARGTVPLLPGNIGSVAASVQVRDQQFPAGSEPKPDPALRFLVLKGPTVTPVADEATTTGMGVETEGATTTTSGLDAGMDSGNIHESPLRSYKAPLPEGNTLGSAEDSLILKELMDIIPKLVLIIDNLGEERTAADNEYYGKLVLDFEDEETEDQGRKIQDIDDNPLVSLVRNSMEEKEADFVTPKKVSVSGEAQEEDISPTTLEAAKTLSKVASQNVSTYKRRAMSASKGKDIGIGMDFFSAAKERLNSAKVKVNTEVNLGSARVNTGNTPVSTPSVIQTMNVIVPSRVKSQREEKAPMTSEDVQATQKTKEQIRQEEAGLAEAMRLQALQDEEDARQVHLDALLAKRIQEEQELSDQQQKRKAEVQEAA